MNKFVDWLNSHSGAIIAFGSALGIFAHAISPEFAAATGEGAHKLFMVSGLIGAIMTAYAQGTGTDE